MVFSRFGVIPAAAAGEQQHSLLLEVAMALLTEIFHRWTPPVSYTDNMMRKPFLVPPVTSVTCPGVKLPCPKYCCVAQPTHGSDGVCEATCTSLFFFYWSPAISSLTALTLPMARSLGQDFWSTPWGSSFLLTLCFQYSSAMCTYVQLEKQWCLYKLILTYIYFSRIICL